MMISLLLINMGCTNSQPVKNASSKPDIILVSIDSLRRDHVSAYGYARKTSPFIDDLAADGSRFDKAQSTSSWTLPAHTTMMTGIPSVEHQIVEDSLKIDPSIPMLAESFQASGYDTAGFVSATFVSRLYGFERGFDRFKDYDLHTDKHNLNAEIDAKRLIDDAIEWRNQQKSGDAAFLFLHFYDAHYEYAPPPPHDTLFDRAKTKDDIKYKNYFHHRKHPLSKTQMAHQIAQYDEGIHYVDSQLKRLNQAIKKAGREAIWIITSDHGEEFGERGTWGHAHTLYSEQLDIPLIFSGPGIPKQEIPDDVGLSDIAPTLAAIANIPIPDQSKGRNLIPAMKGEPLAPKNWTAETSRFNTNRVSMKKGRFRLEWDLKTNSMELFNQKDDPLERINLIENKAKIAEEIKGELLNVMAQKTWHLRKSGSITVSKGVLLHDDIKQTHTYQTGEAFGIWPADARIRHQDLETFQSKGPFSILKNQQPNSSDPVILKKRQNAEVTLSDGIKDRLEALGYMQGD